MVIDTTGLFMLGSKFPYPSQLGWLMGLETLVNLTRFPVSETHWAQGSPMARLSRKASCSGHLLTLASVSIGAVHCSQIFQILGVSQAGATNLADGFS